MLWNVPDVEMQRHRKGNLRHRANQKTINTDRQTIIRLIVMSSANKVKISFAKTPFPNINPDLRVVFCCCCCCIVLVMQGVVWGKSVRSPCVCQKCSRGSWSTGGTRVGDARDWASGGRSPGCGWPCRNLWRRPSRRRWTCWRAVDNPPAPLCASWWSSNGS